METENLMQEYSKLQAEIKLNITHLEILLKQHQKSFNQHGNWGYIGELNTINEDLKENIDFLK